jgi:hypothetical protein
MPIPDRPQFLAAIVLLVTAAFVASGWIKQPFAIWWRRTVIVGYLLALGLVLVRGHEVAYAEAVSRQRAILSEWLIRCHQAITIAMVGGFPRNTCHRPKKPPASPYRGYSELAPPG